MTKRFKYQPLGPDYKWPHSVLGVSENDWEISITYTKGALSGQRGVVVDVKNKKTGKKKRISKTARTKAESREIGKELAAILVKELH